MDDYRAFLVNLHQFGEVIVMLQVCFEVGDSAVRVPVAANVGPLNKESKCVG